MGGPMGGNNSRSKSATTDSEGAYAIDALRAGSYTVSARAKDRMSATKRNVKVDEARPTEGVDLVLGAGEMLSGIVTDVEGEPIQGASVNVSAQESAQAQTDAQGHFEVKGLAKGEVSISVSKQGFVSAQSSLQIPSGRAVPFKLERTAKIAGVLRAEGVTTFKSYQVYATDEASVAAQKGNRPNSNEAYSNRNDPSGSFEIDVKAGTYVLHALAQGFAPAASESITVKAGERVDGIVIDLTRGGSIEGVVIAKATGQPVEGASVSVSSQDGSIQQSFRFGPPTDSTDAEGRFKLQGLPTATLNVTSTHKDFAQATVLGVNAREGQTASTRLEMSTGGGIRGIVRKGGAALANLRVYAASLTPGASSYKEALTDKDGRYELKSLAAGDYNVQATRQDGRGMQLQGRVTVYEGQTAELDLVQEVGIVVSGHVLLGGVPVRGGRIEAMRKASPGGGLSAKIEDDGSYSLEVPGPGSYVLMVRVANLGRQSQARADLVVPEGSVDLRQDIDLPAGEIAGVVVDAVSGVGIEGAQVFVVPDGTTARTFTGLFEGFRGMDRTDAQGRFVVTALEAGLYSLRVSRSGYAGARIDKLRVDGRRSPQEPRVPLEPSIAFRARIVDSEGRPVQGATVLLRDEGGELAILDGPNRSDDSGVVNLAGVRPAIYEISAVHPSFAVSRLTVEARDGGEVALQLLPGARLQVTVVNRQGKPLQGASIDLLDAAGANVADDLIFASLMSTGSTPTTQADGTLVLEQVTPGKYRVAARTDRGRSREERVTIEDGKTAEARLVVGE